jgi:hypothetical protein
LQLNHFFYPGEFGRVTRVVQDISRGMAKRDREIAIYTTKAFERMLPPKQEWDLTFGSRIIIMKILKEHLNCSKY